MCQGTAEPAKYNECFPLTDKASVWKSFQFGEFPDGTIVEGTNFKSLKQLFVRNFKEEISFLALISAPLILSEDIVSWHF